MAIFISAGHHLKDPGAIGNGYKEADLTRELRDLVCKELDKLGGKYITDKDSETLAQYIARIQPGSGSVVCEFHFNASSNPDATGIETLIREKHTSHEKELAEEINNTIVKVLGLKNRGVKTEKDSARGRLAILNDGAGLSILPEICFISNKKDVESFIKNKEILAKEIAKVLLKHDLKFS